MSTLDLIRLLGWTTALFFILAFSNYFVKVINKKYISKLGKEKKQTVDFYRKIMKLIIKNHKIFGIIAFVLMLAHYYTIFTANLMRLSGIIAALLLIVIVSLGFYGGFISKNKKGMWLKIHRILPFILIIVIVFHVVFRKY
ncbi:MAG: hypothetical protein ACOH15_02560 [Acetobacterium sp.]